MVPGIVFTCTLVQSSNHFIVLQNVTRCQALVLWTITNNFYTLLLELLAVTIMLGCLKIHAFIEKI